jgi:hypothetical protein
MKEEFATIEMGERELKKFGLTVGGILLAITLFVAIMKEGNIHYGIPIIGLLLIGFGLFYARALEIPYKLWMGLAIVLGFVVGNLLLGILFFVFVTPIAVLKRIFETKKKKQGETYWIKREKSWTRESMEQLF